MTITNSIREIAKAVHQNARDKGWWLPYLAKEGAIRELSADQVLSKLMLVVSELAEACEIIREPNCDPRAVWFEEVSEKSVEVKGPTLYFKKGRTPWPKDASQAFLSDKTFVVTRKPEGFPIEIADAVIRAFDLCEAMGIDLAAAIDLKCQYNLGRTQRHGNKRA